MVRTNNGILFSLIKEENFDIDEVWRHDAKWDKPDMKGQIFHNSPYMR